MQKLGRGALGMGICVDASDSSVVRWGLEGGASRVVPDEVGVIQSFEKFIVVNEVFQAGVTGRLLHSHSVGDRRYMTGCTFRTSSELIMLLYCVKRLFSCRGVARFVRSARSFAMIQK